MANRIVGEISFEADGKTYTLLYSHDALIELEERLDRGIVSIIKEMQEWAKDPESLRLGTVRALLWAGLRKHHPEIDLIAAGELISAAGGIGEILGIAGEGIRRAFDSSGTKDARPTIKKRKNGIGTDSSPNMSHSDTPSEAFGTSPPQNIK